MVDYLVLFSVLCGRVESYSCKMAGSDKKLYKQLSTQEPVSTTCASHSPAAIQALSPPQTLVGSPVYGSPILPQSGLPSVLIRTISGCSSHSESSNGPQFRDTVTSKTLFYLKSTLNASFYPDYDFSDAKSEEFSQEPSLQWIKDAVRANLSYTDGNLEAQLWDAVDEEIQLKDCEIYRYCIMKQHVYSRPNVHSNTVYTCTLTLVQDMP